MKIAISIGHHPDKPGIHSGQYTEHSEMAPIAGYLIQTLIYMGHKPYVVAAGPLPDKIQAVNKLNADCAIELHLNAGGGDGAETLYCPGSENGYDLASIIHDEIMYGYYRIGVNIDSRGIKEGWYRMIRGGSKDAFLEQTNCPAVITEMYFLDNDIERKLFAGNPVFYQNMALALANGFHVWGERNDIR